MKPACVALIIAVAAGAAFADDARQRLEVLRQRLPDFQQQIEAVRAMRQDPSYPLVSLTVLNNFIEYAREDLDRPMPDGWVGDARNTNAAMAIDTAVAAEGQRSLKITNSTPQSPNVFGMFWHAQPLQLTPGRRYIISARVRSDDPGVAWMGGGERWQIRAPFRRTGARWGETSTTFTAEAADAAFVLRIVTESPTSGIWVDRVSVVDADGGEEAANLVSAGDFEGSWTDRRALMQIEEMEGIAQRLGEQLASVIAGEAVLPAVPRWTGQQRPQISGPALIGPAHDGLDRQYITQRPIFFIGYGHFHSVRREIERFPDYGINLVQNGEFGPAQVFVTPDTVSDEPMRNLRDQLDRAAAAGVGVDLLLSPHYFPQWMVEKHPHLARRRQGGFFPYSPYAPEGFELVRRFVKLVLEPIKDHPALFSICLTNEPSNFEEPGEHSLRYWRQWLRGKHRTIERLNQRWGSGFASFDDVPLPDPFNPDAVRRPSPHWNDFVRWNQEWFAGWHARLAEEVRAVAPDVPVHAKATTWLFVSENSAIDSQYGVDPTLFADFSDLHGNDSLCHYTYGRGEFAQDWLREAKGYELLRSVKDMPTFNSENHLVPDRETRAVPPQHIRAALWQAAMRGQSATTIWVWERTYDPAHDFAGSIKHRPACAEAVGIVNHDLNRVAHEAAKIQRIKPQLLVLHSTTASAWDGFAYDRCLDKLFAALSFTGHRVGFVTERQLERGVVPEAPAIFVPNVTHLSDEAFDALSRFTGRVVLVGGEDVLARNEYDHPRRVQAPGRRWTLERISYEHDVTTARQLWDLLRPQIARQHPPAVHLTGAAGEAVWAVEWKTAVVDGQMLVNVCNYGHEPVRVRLHPVQSFTRRPSVIDLLSGQSLWGDGGIELDLSPLDVRLVRISGNESE